jgi:hypothetical protein
MTGRPILFYILGVISLLCAVYFFFIWFEFKYLLPFALAIGGVVFFWLGSDARKKK